jgi:ATP-dependent DNA helicase PIF1
MDQHIRELLESGKNFAISGPGGVGKSFQLNHIIKYCREQNIKCAITASTGIAALLIGGTTLHHWCGITPMMVKKFQEGNYLFYPDKKKANYKRVISAKTLIIDEVSMIGKDTFDLVDVVCKTIRSNSAPFGGIQVILSFDMLQLPPVKEDYVFKSDTWSQLNLQYVYLSKIYRTSDEMFISILQRAREGRMLKEDIDILQSRRNIRNEEFDRQGIEPTLLFSHRVDVNEINYDRLSNIKASCLNYKSMDMVVAKGGLIYKNGVFSKKANVDQQEDIKKLETYINTMLPTECMIKTGAQVMLTVNLAVSEGLVNGSRGVVVSCDASGVDVMFKSQKVKVTYFQQTYEEGEYIFIREYMPLKLAWALTLHSVQGQSLDYAIIDLGKNIFCPGQAYVGLSRLRSLEGLVLSDFDYKKVFASKMALEFEKQIQMFNTSKTLCSHNTKDENDTEP